MKQSILFNMNPFINDYAGNCWVNDFLSRENKQLLSK